MKAFNAATPYLAATLIALLACSCSKQFDLDYEKVQNTPVSTVYPKAENSIRLVSYNVGTFNKYSMHCYTLIACLLKELDADVAGMQELDSCSSRTGNVFQLKCVADLLNYSYAYAGARVVQNGTYGTGLISRNRILRKFSIALPEGGEPRSIAVAELDDYVVAATHFDLLYEAQEQEAEYLNQRLVELYGSCGKPVFLLGDLNVQPDSPILQILKEHWEILSVEEKSYPSRNPSMCLDYILQLKNGVKCRVVDAQIPTQFVSGSVTDASDHLPIYVDVNLNPD